VYRLNIEEKKTKQRDHNGSGGERGGGQGFSDRVQGGRGERGSQVIIKFVFKSYQCTREKNLPFLTVLTCVEKLL